MTTHQTQKSETSSKLNADGLWVTGGREQEWGCVFVTVVKGGTADCMTVDRMAVDIMTVERMAVDSTTVDSMTVDNGCRQHDSARPIVWLLHICILQTA